MKIPLHLTISLFVWIPLYCVSLQATALESTTSLISPDIKVYSTKHPETAQDVAATIDVLDEK